MNLGISAITYIKDISEYRINKNINEQNKDFYHIYLFNNNDNLKNKKYYSQLLDNKYELNNYDNKTGLLSYTYVINTNYKYEITFKKIKEEKIITKLIFNKKLYYYEVSIKYIKSYYINTDLIKLKNDFCF